MLSRPLIALALAGSLIGPVARAASSAGLEASTSAFLRSQAGSAVQWHAWNDATLAEARKANRSVYVFIGSPLSELTRATITQTFASAKTVTWLNESFFCIFVDADQDPELAAYAQHYIRSVKQLQGVPVHLWLTPDLQPYDGANYLPPSEEWGKPGFLKAARSALETWTGSPDRARSLAKEAISLMRVPPLGTQTTPAADAKLEASAKAWIAAIDPVNGGFGTAPKQPEPELIRFLLTRDSAARDAALNAAHALVKGATRDATDGGFFRRCIDEAWKEPYFQKTLADQARIALALFEAAEASKDDSLRQAGMGALSFALTELRNADGSFASALDGTLDENAAPGTRPKAVRVGVANTGAEALLVCALQHSGEPRLRQVATELAAKWLDAKAAVMHGAGTKSPGTAYDHTAVALALRTLREDAAAARVLTQANELYFDANTGVYQASPAALRSGIGARVPAFGDSPSPETLALLAKVDATVAGAIRRALLSGIEYDEQPSGDVLLGLAGGK